MYHLSHKIPWTREMPFIVIHTVVTRSMATSMVRIYPSNSGSSHSADSKNLINMHHGNRYFTIYKKKLRHFCILILSISKGERSESEAISGLEVKNCRSCSHMLWKAKAVVPGNEADWCSDTVCWKYIKIHSLLLIYLYLEPHKILIETFVDY